MVLSPSPAFEIAIAESSVDLVVVLEIDIDGSEVIRFCTGATPIDFGDGQRPAIPEILDISPISSAIDPITRESSASSWTITLLDHHADGEMRRLHSAGYEFRGKQCSIRIGTPDLALSSYLTLISFLEIDDIIPQPGALELELVDAWNPILDKIKIYGMPTVERTGNFYQYISINVVEEIAELLEYAVPTNVATGLTNGLRAGSYPTVEHFCSNAWQRGGREINERELISDLNGLAKSIYATLLADDPTNGFRLLVYDQNSSAVDNWTEDDVSDFDQIETYQRAFNRVEIGSRSVPERTAGGVTTRSVPYFLVEDTQAQSDFSYPDGSDFVKTLKFDEPLIYRATRIDGQYYSDSPDYFSYYPTASGTQIRAIDATIKGFTGATGSPASGTDDLIYPISSTYPAYLYVSGPLINGVLAEEYMRAENATYVRERQNSYLEVNALGAHDGFATQEGQQPFGSVIYDIVRDVGADLDGSAGTDPVNWRSYLPPFGLDSVTIRDISLAVHVGRSIIQRCSRGLPVIKCRTDLRKIAIQIGDFVTLTHRQFFGLGLSGSDSTCIFEITQKSVNLTGDSVGIDWELTWVRQSTASPVTPSVSAPSIPPGLTPNNDNPYIDTNGNPYSDILGNWYYPI